MVLSPGTRLGPYEIIAPLGAGGMGEVYRARDTRLDRTVAIKVIAPAMAADPELRSRFESEARAISALDHPHICTLHDVGEQQGVHYLVMQYLEGETLAARLTRSHDRGLPLPEAVRIASEIADALDKAHRAGITHRDLKPSNIMLTKAGAKLLDFGLAKLRGQTPVALPEMTHLASPAPGTAHGTILGTVPYMAPEQVEGKDADARSDIFAFGAVVYEMVTGHRAFKGGSPASVIGAILKEQPPPISTLQPLAPPTLEDAIGRCLEKDPDDRWQSARDLVLELRRISKADAALPASQQKTRGSIRRERLTWMAVAASLLIALIAVGWSSRAADPPRSRIASPVRFTLTSPPGSTITTPTISPDGRRFALAANTAGRTQLWVQPVDSLQALPIAGTEGVTHHFWSPDSRLIGFFAQGKLKTVDVMTGTISVVCNATNPRGGAWGADRTIVLASSTGEGLFRVSADGGTPVAQTALDPSRQESSHRWPVFLPGGRHFIYLAMSGRPENTGIYLGSLDAPGVRRLVNAISNAAYAPPGFLLFVRGSALLAQPFDPTRLEVHGEPVTVLDRAGYDPTILLAQFSVSDTDVGVFANAEPNQVRVVWVDRRGIELEAVSEPGAYAHVALSPDNTRVAATRYESASSDIWLFDSSRGAPSRLTFDPSHDQHPLWSPDGRQVVFGSNRDGFMNLYRKAAGGGGEELLLASNQVKYPSDWSRDGRYIIYDNLDADTKLDIWMLPLFGDRKPFPFLQTPFDEWLGHLSPDGRWIAYTSNASGRYEVYVQSFPPSGATWQISTQGGLHPRWRQDQKELFYVASDQKLMGVPIRTGATFEYGVPAALFEMRLPRAFEVRAPYQVSRDGQRFLLTRTHGEATPPTVIVNWTAGLKQ